MSNPLQRTEGYTNFLIDEYPNFSIYEKTKFKQEGFYWISIKIFGIPIYGYREFPIFTN